MSDNLSLGRLGEKIASEYLQKQGYKILEMNFHKRWGELDIVAIDNETLVAVEVKTRMINDFISPEESVGPWKKKSVTKSFLYYKSLHPELPELLRIDFVGVVLREDLYPLRINLIKNIS